MCLAFRLRARKRAPAAASESVGCAGSWTCKRFCARGRFGVRACTSASHCARASARAFTAGPACVRFRVSLRHERGVTPSLLSHGHRLLPARACVSARAGLCVCARSRLRATNFLAWMPVARPSREFVAIEIIWHHLRSRTRLMPTRPSPFRGPFSLADLPQIGARFAPNRASDSDIFCKVGGHFTGEHFGLFCVVS